MEKQAIFEKIEHELTQRGFTIVEKDDTRPWGGFFKVADTDAPKFIETYFAGIDLPETTQNATLSPKILIVEPGKKLSWQVHDRRAEFWRVIEGPVAAFLNETDEHPESHQTYQATEIIDVGVKMRHRLVGLETWGIVAEIWIHTDPNQPSNEDDIIRLADDFGR